MNLVEELSEAFGVSPATIVRIVTTAPKRYKVYAIPKRRGGKRIIAQPSRELKAIQRYLMREKLSKFPVHPSAMAYVGGRNILQNAEKHQSSRVILKLDFTEFFPSLRVTDFVRFLKAQQPAEPMLKDVRLYSNLLFWGARSHDPICLSIGAPTSPMLSNILMHGLDVIFHERATASQVSYSRYADDITISGPTIETVLKYESSIRDIVKHHASPRLKFNDEKRGLYLRGQKRMVTGLIITPSGTISIGRERKRLASTIMHRFSLGQATPEQRAKLKGLLGFSVAVEPQFLNRLRGKYGDQVVDESLTYHVPSGTAAHV